MTTRVNVLFANANKAKEKFLGIALFQRVWAGKAQRLRAAFAALLLSTALSSQAVDLTICADTVAEIEQGILAASNPNLPEDRVVIAVAQGDYDLTNSQVLVNTNQTRVINRTLFLLGGYAGPATCSVRTLQPANTVLRNTSALRRLAFQQNADFTVSGFHWLNFEGQINISNSSANTSQQDLEFSYNRITGGRGNVELRVATDGPISSIFVRNNIIAGRPSFPNNFTWHGARRESHFSSESYVRRRSEGDVDFTPGD